jgi:hypothetical protein
MLCNRNFYNNNLPFLKLFFVSASTFSAIGYSFFIVLVSLQISGSRLQSPFAPCCRPRIAANVPAALRSGGGSQRLGRAAHLQITTNVSAGAHPALRQTACWLLASYFNRHLLKVVLEVDYLWHF